MDEVKKIIVFGGTGNTGKAIIETALQQGFEVTAFVRTPSKLPLEIRDQVKVIVGVVTDKKAVEDALEGQHAVFSSLSPGRNKIIHFKPVTIISNGCINIVSGMRKHGVKKIGVVSASFTFENAWRPFIMKELINDHLRQVDYLKQQDDIQWFAMLPSVINSRKVVGDYLVSKGRIPGSLTVSSYEIADFMVKCISDKMSLEHFNHSMIGISSNQAKISDKTIKIIKVSTTVAIIGLCVWYFTPPKFFDNSLGKIKNLFV